MKLRLRLAVAVVVVTAPMIATIVWLDARARQQAADDELARLVMDRALRDEERGRCEADPAQWPGPPPRFGRPGGPPPGGGERPPGPGGPGGPGGPPPEGMRFGHRRPARFFVYDAAGRSSEPGAPALDAEALALAPGAYASRSSTMDELHSEIVLRTSWNDGPCAFIVAQGTKEPWLGAILPETRIWLAPIVIVIAAVLLAIGPVIRRILRLTRQVERSALSGYTAPVRVDGRDEIGDLARAFDAAAQAVRAELTEKDRREEALRRFLADTTHDVMIPLTVLKGHLATLQERLAGSPADPVMTRAMDEAHYIGALLQNLSAVAKLDAAEPRLHSSDVDLNALVDRVMGRHRPIAEQHRVEIASAVPDEPMMVRGDVTLIEQAAGNLVYNAIRHNRAGGHVAVILEPAAGRGFQLRVVDDGPGIPAEELSRLVERGFRGNEARTRTPDGQGLGLYIVQRVADLHGWKLSFRAAEGGGLEAEVRG